MEKIRVRRLVAEVLREAGVRPSRRLGQHFLVDLRGSLLFLKGLQALNAREALEIGPGAGSITFEASRILDRIVAVEVDYRLAYALASRAPPNVAVILGDGVDAARSYPIRHVYSNTPFSLSSEIVEALACNNMVEGAVLGVQREVAARLAAKPGSSEYGRLSVLAALVFEVKVIGVIPPSWYHPRPEVYTSVVLLRRRRKWSGVVEAALKLASCAFTTRRKLAGRVLERCLKAMGCTGVKLEALGGRRVWDLAPGELESIAVECMKSRLQEEN